MVDKYGETNLKNISNIIIFMTELTKVIMQHNYKVCIIMCVFDDVNCLMCESPCCLVHLS